MNGNFTTNVMNNILGFDYPKEYTDLIIERDFCQEYYMNHSMASPEQYGQEVTEEYTDELIKLEEKLQAIKDKMKVFQKQNPEYFI